MRRRHFDTFGQQDARGRVHVHRRRRPGRTSPTSCSASRTAARLRSATPTSSCADRSLESYVNDDWRLSPSLTLNLGVRWEYESPLTEKLGRLVNLDIDVRLRGGGARSSPATRWARSPGPSYPASLVRADPRGVQPRLGLAWRPVAGSSLVIRAGYGVYRNTNVYQSIALAMAQQPPLSKAVNVGELARNAAHARQWLHRRRRRARRTPSPSIRTCASASRRTGRCPRSAICRRRSPSSPPISARPATG